jgi:hypothetical protein
MHETRLGLIYIIVDVFLVEFPLREFSRKYEASFPWREILPEGHVWSYLLW